MDMFYKATEGSPLFQFLATLLGALNVVCSGLHYGWTSPSLLIIQSNSSAIEITDGEGSTIAVMLLVGGVTGSLITGLIVDNIGRKTVILLSVIPEFGSWMLIAYSNTLWQLLLARFFGGVADGMSFCALSVYAVEITEPRYRGLIAALTGIAYSIGELLMNAFGGKLGLRNAALLCSTLPVLLLITFFWMPESPYYLLTQDKIKEAEQSLKILRGKNDVEEDLIRIKDWILNKKSTKSSSLNLLRKPHNRKALIVALVIRGVQQASGITAILFYIQTVFQEASYSSSFFSAYNSTIIYLSIQTIVSTAFSIFIDRVGRKPLLLISMGGSSLALFTVAAFFYIKYNTEIDTTQFSLVPVIGLITYIFMFSIALQTFPNLIMAEIFPTDVRATAVVVNDIFFAVAAIAVAKYFQIAKDTLGLEIPTFTFSLCCFLGVVFVLKFLPETKGKTLEEIQLLFSKKFGSFDSYKDGFSRDAISIAIKSTQSSTLNSGG